MLESCYFICIINCLL